MNRRYFGTDGIRGKVGSLVINPEFMLRLGYSSGLVLKDIHGISPNICSAVLVAKDTRSSGYMLENALQAGLLAAGLDVILVEESLPTSAVAFLTKSLNLTAGIMVSASHNSFEDNGVKFFSSLGMKLSSEVEELIELKLNDSMICANAVKLGRVIKLNDGSSRYINFCKNIFQENLDLSKVSVIIDASHGAAYKIAPLIFNELGAQVHLIGCTPNGININYGKNNFYPDALLAEIKNKPNHIGLFLDGDADRLLIIEQDGTIYNGDHILYAILLGKMLNGPVNGVVGTIMTNYGFELKMQELNIPFIRTGVGDRYILEQLKYHGWKLGGESSGHIICLDYHTTSDGIISALQVFYTLNKYNVSLKDLLYDLNLYYQKTINIPLDQLVKYDDIFLQQLSKELKYELGNKGRVIIRRSGTEPMLRLMVETKTESETEFYINKLTRLLLYNSSKSEQILNGA